MGGLEYWRKVGLPLWWKDFKVVLMFFVSTVFLIVWLIPRGYLAYRKERNNAGTVRR